MEQLKPSTVISDVDPDYDEVHEEKEEKLIHKVIFFVWLWLLLLTPSFIRIVMVFIPQTISGLHYTFSQRMYLLFFCHTGFVKLYKWQQIIS